MLLVARPSDDAVERYRADRVETPATFDPRTDSSLGFHRDSVHVDLGSGDAALERGRLGIEQWVAHRDGGVDVTPHGAPIEPGTVVTLVTRQLGVWVLAACRITDVTDDADSFGFTYATLPDHPARGVESFTVRRDPNTGDVGFEIAATSRPDVPLVRLVAPVARRLQHHAITRYAAALRTFVASP